MNARNSLKNWGGERDAWRMRKKGFDMENLPNGSGRVFRVLYHTNTVDARNSAPVRMVNIPISTGFHTCQVVQDFFHQQYVFIYIYTHTHTP